MVVRDTTMDKHEEALWKRTFKLCGVYAHPQELTQRQREQQKLLIDALNTETAIMGRWPKNKKFNLWSDWYDTVPAKKKAR